MREKVSAIVTTLDPFEFGVKLFLGGFAALGVCLIFGAAINYVVPASWMGSYDSTDKKPERSGLGLYTDAMTGCQYLSAKGSGITPRLDENGKQICRKGE